MTELEKLKEQLIKQGFDEKNIDANDVKDSCRYDNFVFYYRDKIIQCKVWVSYNLGILPIYRSVYFILEPTDTPNTIMAKTKQALLDFIKDYKTEGVL